MKTRNIIEICSVCLILVLFSVQGVFSFSVSTVNEDRLYIDNTAKENESVSERHLDNPDGLSFDNLMNQVGDFLSPSIWLSDDPEDLKPLIDTEWEFTFTIISTFTDTITFGSNIESTSDGTVGLQCTNQYGSRGYVFYGDLPTGGTGYSTVIEGYLLIEFYLFNISGNSATGKYMHKNKSTGRYSNVYNMTGIKTRGGKPEQPPVISEIEDVTIEAGIPWNSPAPDIISGTTPVTWSLIKAPDAMVIESSTGIVSWEDPLEGVYLVSLKAENSAGSTNTSFLLTVEANPKKCAASYLMGDDYPGLNSLRLFRDNILSKNNAGILLIAIYYDKSSNVIEICEQYPFLKPLFRKIIEAVIPVVNLITAEGA